MSEIFLELLNRSISAGWLVLAVVLARFALKKAPKRINCLLWAMVGFRLICPVSLESALSLIPSGETVPAEIVYTQQPAIDSGVEIIDRVVNPAITARLAPSDAAASINPIQVWLFVAGVIWVIGVAAMGIYALVSYLRLKKKVRAAVRLQKNIWICDYIDTPFILGIVRPKIYLSSAMEEKSAAYVLAHEQAHLKHRDHWWKPLGYLILSVYWFNPLMWLAYILLCRDIELACDEKVVKTMGIEDKKAYSLTLLECSVSHRMVAACPLAFGEVGVKERVKTVLNYKKPGFWVILVAVIACIVVAVCFLTDPVEDETTDPVETIAGNPQEIGSVVAGVGYGYANVYVRIPEGWEYETVSNEDMTEFGVAFWPEGYVKGQVKLMFMENFGVCGTGLETETVAFENGMTASVGYYDGGSVWNFVNFNDTPGYYVALTEAVDEWWPEYGDQVLEILSTAELGRGYIRQSEAVAVAAMAFGKPYHSTTGVYDYETGIWQIHFYEHIYDSSPAKTISVDAAGNLLDPMGWGVTMTVTDVNSTGLILHINRGEIVTTGELTTGSEFWLERWDGTQWEPLPEEYAGEFAWTMEAWVLMPNKTVSRKLNWSNLYADLPEGTYRIGKTIQCDSESQAYYAYFQIPEEELTGGFYEETTP